MLHIFNNVRRRMLLFVAIAGTLVAWQGAALAGSHSCGHTIFGAQSSSEVIIVLFEVYDPSPPMPHYVSAGLPQEQLDFVVSTQIIQDPPFWANLYGESVTGFETGKQYRAKYYRQVDQDLIYQKEEVWTQE